MLRESRCNLLTKEEPLALTTCRSTFLNGMSSFQERVEEKEGIPPQQQRLIFSGKQVVKQYLSEDLETIFEDCITAFAKDDEALH